MVLFEEYKEENTVQDQGTSPYPLSMETWIHRLTTISGFLVLATMTCVLFGLSMQQAWLSHLAGGVFSTTLLGLMLFTLLQQARTLSKTEPSAILSRTALLNFIAVVGGGLVTYSISRDVGVGAVVASGTIGLLGALILPDHAVPIYCGSFVGMVSPALLGSYSQVLLAAVIAGVAFVLSTGTFDGFGGKLGTIAFSGTVLTGLVLPCQFIPAEVPTGPVVWQVILCAVGAAVFTYWLSVDLGHGAVLGSSVVGLLAGLFLPVLAPEAGGLLAVVTICASFTGMSSPSRIDNHFWIMVAGLATGIVFIYCMPHLGGAGGKLGTLAFGSGMGTYALRSLLSQIGLSV